jgi:GH24 family phage-related lysozyme (muramidase)
MKKAAKEILNGPRMADGKVLSGLVTRRKEEAQLFLLPDNKSIY